MVNTDASNLVRMRGFKVSAGNRITHFLHIGQEFPHQLPVLENVITPPCKTSRVR